MRHASTGGGGVCCHESRDENHHDHRGNRDAGGTSGAAEKYATPCKQVDTRTEPQVSYAGTTLPVNTNPACRLREPRSEEGQRVIPIPFSSCDAPDNVPDAIVIEAIDLLKDLE